jgi:hypothetical protein
MDKGERDKHGQRKKEKNRKTWIKEKGERDEKME